MSVTQGIAKTARGGIDAGGAALDTIIAIGGAGQKELLKIFASVGNDGGGIPAASLPFFARLVVLDGGRYDSLAAGTRFGVGIPLVGVSLDDFGGRMLFDIDLVFSSTLGVQLLDFSEAASEGRMIATAGVLNIIMTAPRTSAGALVTNMTGKLTAQMRNVYNHAESRDYGHMGISRSVG